MVRSGLIGNGYWGMKLDNKLNKISDRKFIQTSKNYNTGLFKDVDWVFIATPTNTHFRIAKDCMNQGVNVFIEKPFCSTLAEAQELVKIARENEILLYIDNVFLHRDELNIIKDFNFNSIKFKWHKYGPFYDTIINDLLYHDLYLLITFAGFSNINSMSIIVNQPDILKFNFNYEDKIVHIDYNRIISNSVHKSISLDGRTIDFINNNQDPLLHIVERCLNMDHDFVANQELNLYTMELMDVLKLSL